MSETSNEISSQSPQPTILGAIARGAQFLRTGSTAISDLALVTRGHRVDTELQEDVLLIEEVYWDLVFGKGDPADDDGFVNELGSALVKAYRENRRSARAKGARLVRGVVVPALTDETAFTELGVAGMLLKDLGIAEGFEVEPHTGYDCTIAVYLEPEAATVLARMTPAGE